MSIWKKIAITALFLTVTFPVQAHEFKKDKLMISHPYIRETPPKAPVAGGFMQIKNMGAHSDRLIGGTASFARKVEIHDMSMENNIMKMFQIENGLEIPAGETVTLKPGSLHVMFMKLQHQMKQGESYPVTLQFEKAGSVDVIFNIEKMKRSTKKKMSHSH